MSQWQISRLTRFHTPADAHQIGAHGIERCGLGVNGHTICRLQPRQPSVKLRPSQYGFIVFVASDRDHRFWLGKQIVHGHECRFGRGAFASASDQTLKPVLFIEGQQVGLVGRRQPNGFQ